MSPAGEAARHNGLAFGVGLNTIPFNERGISFQLVDILRNRKPLALYMDRITGKMPVPRPSLNGIGVKHWTPTLFFNFNSNLIFAHCATSLGLSCLPGRLRRTTHHTRGHFCPSSMMRRQKCPATFTKDVV